MARIKGITVTLLQHVQTDTDPFGQPVYDDIPVTVDNVLIAPLTAEDLLSQTSLTGRKVSYQLAIPKGDTHTWEGAEVWFWGQRWQVVGIPTQGIDDLIPLDWNLKVEVERIE